MGIRTKFNLAALLVFVLGFGTAWLLLERQFIAAARTEVLQNARVMLSAANAIRAYTVAEVRPAIIADDPDRIEPLTVPSYAAQANLRLVRNEFREFIYKEAALNPTNPADRATDWEADIIHAFRNAPDLPELVTERDTPTGRQLTLARPARITDAACLSCHSTPERAPPRLVQVYGPNNGFGWRMNETVGAQLVSVPMALALGQAQANLHSAMALLAAVFAGLVVVLNLLLYAVVVRPVRRISRLATAVSLGQPDVAEIPDRGRDEVSELGRAFTRMRRSLEQALRMLNA